MKAFSSSLLILSSLAISHHSIASDVPNLKMSARATHQGFEILMTGIDKPVTVTDATINNGYCQLSVKRSLAEKLNTAKSGSFNTKNKPGFPFTINVGETRVIQSRDYDCQLQTIELTTPNGRFSWDWE